MSKLLNSQGEPIKKEVDESKLPTVDQILKDPITKKFLFLESVDYPDQTCIGLTEETDQMVVSVNAPKAVEEEEPILEDGEEGEEGAAEEGEGSDEETNSEEANSEGSEES